MMAEVHEDANRPEEESLWSLATPPSGNTGTELQATLRFARKAYRRLRSEDAPYSYEAVTVEAQAASDLIKARLVSDEPVLVARLGGTELTCALNHLGVNGDASTLRRSLAFVRGRVNFDNDHWVRPLPSERPPDYLRIENGCYW